MRPKLFFLLPLLAACNFILVNAQTGPQLANVARPSPDVQGMQKYGDIPISAYTGIPNISVPIYTAKFRDISVPITLSYHAGGIKVSEEAGHVGLGWTLNAGGTISRNIVGQDDFNAYVYFAARGNTLTDMSNGQGPTKNVITGCVETMFNKSIPGNPTIYTTDFSNAFNGSPQSDFQPDQYYLNVMGESGKFILKRDMTAVLQSQKKLQISCTASDGSTWQVKALDGTIYDFTVFETSSDGTLTHKSAWYLTKITSPTGNTVTFNYTLLPNSGSTYVKSVGSWSETRDDFDEPLSAPGVYGQAANSGYHYGSTPPLEYTQYVLSTIDFTTGIVKFNYSYSRQDIQYDGELDSVQVFAKDKSGNVAVMPTKTVVLTYGYFNGTANQGFGSSANAYDTKRLQLQKVQQVGYYGGSTVAENPYKFSYFDNGQLPCKTSLGRDHWGYYNGKPNTSLIPSVVSLASDDLLTWAMGTMGPERDPDTTYSKSFVLTSIQYPTGGSTEFQYEGNDFDEANSDVNDYSWFSKTYTVVSQNYQFNSDVLQHPGVIYTDTLRMGDEYIYQPPGSGTSPTTSALATTTMNGTFLLNGTSGHECDQISITTEGQVYFALYDSTGVNMIQGTKVDMADLTACTGSNTTACRICSLHGNTVQFNTSYTLMPGKYVWKAYSSGSGDAQYISDITALYTWQVLDSTQTSYTGSVAQEYEFGGGLRIKRVIDHDSISSSNDMVRKYVYHYMADKTGSGTPQEYSYGRRMAKPQYSYFTVSTDQYQQLYETCNSAAYYSLHLMRSSDSEIPLNGSALGSAVGYDQVTELFGENGENGKKVYQYENSPDIIYPYADVFTGTGVPLQPPYGANFADAFNGNLLHETDYANVGGNFIKLKETANTYTTEGSNENIVYGLQNIMGTSTTFGTACSPLTPTPCTYNQLLSYRSIESEWNHISTADEKVYNQGDTTQYAETLTRYYYDDTAHLMPTRTIVNNSKGEQITTKTTYPLDYATSTASDAFTLGVKNLQSAHVIAAPVEKFVQKANNDGSNVRTVGSVLTSYNSTAPTPSLVYQSMLASPSTTFAPASVSAGSLVKDASYESRISFDSYDANGNILQQHKVNDINHAYVWDYQNSLPVAEAVNAPQTKTAYTSFEFDGSGNWTIGSTTRDATKAITGKQAYSLANGNISKSTGIVAGDTLVVSYWSNSGVQTVSGTTGSVLTGKTVTLNSTSWTYYEHTVTGVTTVTVSGSGTIDELRLYPKYAQITSYTFDPIIGMTSQCDVNNRVSYYEYDGLGRLKDIKDQDGNILKTFDYHYKQ